MGLFGLKNREEKVPNIKWFPLKDEETLTRLIRKESFDKPIVFFKHSTRCSISAMALHRIESKWEISEEDALPVYLDLIAYRHLSNLIAADLSVIHESPQVLIVKDGKCVYSVTHNDIDPRDIKRNL